MKNLKISAVIFDMDGLIIDSEPLWKIAEIETFKEVGFDFSFEMCALTTGMRIDEVVEFWREKLKWENFTNTEIVDKIQNKMIQLIKERVSRNSLKLQNFFRRLDLVEEEILAFDAYFVSFYAKLHHQVFAIFLNYSYRRLHSGLFGQ